MSVYQQDKQYRGESRSRLRARLWQLAGPWWVSLLTGIARLIVSVIVLRFTTTSAAAVGVLLGVIFLGAMLNEFLLAGVEVALSVLQEQVFGPLVLFGTSGKVT